MALEVQPVEYRPYCHTCKTSDAEEKITRCAYCKLHAFCEEHVGDRHHCVSAPKTDPCLDPDAKIQEFRESGFTARGKVVRYIPGDVSVIEGMCSQEGSDKLARRVRSIVRRHLGPNDICLVVTDHNRTPDKSITLLLKAFPKAAAKNPDLQAGMLCYPLFKTCVPQIPLELMIAGRDLLSQLNNPANLFESWLHANCLQGLFDPTSLLDTVARRCVVLGLSDPYPPCTFSNMQHAGPPDATVCQPLALARHEPQTTVVIEEGDNGKTALTGRQTPPDDDDGFEVLALNENDQFNKPFSFVAVKAPSPFDYEDLATVPKGESDDVLSLVHWAPSCAVCDKGGFTFCGACNLLVHEECQKAHKESCGTILPKAEGEGSEVNVRGILNHLMTAIFHVPQGCTILHADCRNEEWPFYKIEDWKAERTDPFGLRVASMVPHQKESLVIAIDGPTVAQQAAIRFTRPNRLWVQATL